MKKFWGRWGTAIVITVGSAGGGATALALQGCPQALGAIVPSLDCGIAIVEDAVEGLSIPAIVAKESARCGVDEAAVAALLLESKDPRLAATPALAEAKIRAAAREGGGS